jgi:hypothetical protein
MCTAIEITASKLALCRDKFQISLTGFMTHFGAFIPAAQTLVLVLASSCFAAERPLTLHPENPHYFLFRGKPEIIITSGEHYGAVLNLDFDYGKYLRTLARDGLNGTRTWAGPYCETPTSFHIASNSLAPLPGRFVCPWARSDQPGYANGGNKFDLTRWDAAYFKRLKDFLTQAGKHSIIVELNLFCPFYEESMWVLSPMNAANNVNGIGAVARTNVYTLDKHGGLLQLQDELVRKIVRELNSFDNLYYEICNEPYFGGVTLEWQRHIADVIVDTEKELPFRHLISQNIANKSARVDNPHPAISIFNFHYASPPAAVAANYALDKVIGDNETGFRGTNEAPYRMEAWDFIVAGGGLFNNLDFSFTVGHEDGTFVLPSSQPGGGSAILRRQLRYLRDFINRFDFLHLQPDKELVQGTLPFKATARALAKAGQDYVVYVRTPAEKEDGGGCRHQTFTNQQLTLTLTLPAGQFSAEWFDTSRGSASSRERFTHDGGTRKLSAPAFEDDIALALRRIP